MQDNQLKIRQELIEQIFSLSGVNYFDDVALSVFRYQAEFNGVYSKYLTMLKVNIEKVQKINQIPFLPIELFKYEKVVSYSDEPSMIFKSSGTSNTSRSSHFILKPQIYDRSLIHCFEHFYGDPSNYVFLALLPNYLEQRHSSLVYMVKKLIVKSSQTEEGFYMENYKDLIKILEDRKNKTETFFLIGVSYALLDLADKFNMDLYDVIIMETGGMKGRKKEIVREELHERLKAAFNVKVIHSEYSMTELMSQAYSKGNGIFDSPPWMKIIIRDLQDPLTFINYDKQGAVNIIDLANIDSCSFIATQDLGLTHSDGSFEILGRLDNSDIRGCSLLIN
jgi:hypothetical protein